jgi:hypothetical protein
MPRRRGRPRKLGWVRKIFESEAEREEWFKAVGCPSELPPIGKQQDAIPAATHDPYGRKVRPTKVVFGESWDHTSATQQTDELLSLHEEAAANEHIKLSAAWQRYVDFMNLFADSLPAERREKVQRLALLEARSRYWEVAPDIAAELGTMPELRAQWERGEIWFRPRYTRQNCTIVVEENPPGMPPDDPEDLDESEEPNGHWEGLKWSSDSTKKGKTQRHT